METRLKERLVGAIVLVAVVVIVVPELLTGPRSDTPDGTPPAQAAAGKIVTIDLASGGRSTEDRGSGTPVSNASPSTARAPSPAAAADAPPAPATVWSTSPSAGPSSTPSSAGPSSTSQSPRTSGENPPAAVGVSTATTAMTASPERADARPASESTAAASPPSRAPVAASPGSAQPRPSPTSASSGWVVQLGSFASRGNAEKLAGELRGSGYSAFVSEFRGSGRVLYRVRVGPEQDRGRADVLAARLARDGRKGTVAPHP